MVLKMVKDRILVNNKCLDKLQRMLASGLVKKEPEKVAMAAWYAWVRYTLQRHPLRHQLEKMFLTITGGRPPVKNKILDAALHVATAPEIPYGSVSKIENAFNKDPENLYNLVAVAIAGQRPGITLRLCRDAVEKAVAKFGDTARYLFGDDTVSADYVYEHPETWVLVKPLRYTVVECVVSSRSRKKKARKKKTSNDSEGGSR